MKKRFNHDSQLIGESRRLRGWGTKKKVVLLGLALLIVGGGVSLAYALIPRPLPALIEQWTYQDPDPVNYFDTSPVVVKGVVYAGSTHGSLYALDTATGHKKWAYQYAHYAVDSSSLTVANGIVYVGLVSEVSLSSSQSDGHIYALDATTGRLKWVFHIGGIFNDGVGSVGVSYASINGVIYVGVSYAGINAGNVYALDAATGRLKWMLHTREGISAAPAIFNGVVYVGFMNGDVYALDVATGHMKWVFHTTSSVSSLVVKSGIVYLDDGNVYALDATTGHMKWADTVGHMQAVVNGTVYVISDDFTKDRPLIENGDLSAINATTGRLKWTYKTGISSASPMALAVANGIVYVGSENGDLSAINATTGRKEWVYHATDGSTIQSLTGVGSVIYVCSGELSAFRLRTPLF